jgi:hypothetical protein
VAYQGAGEEHRMKNNQYVSTQFTLNYPGRYSHGQVTVHTPGEAPCLL